MNELLANNWLWILLGIGVLWFIARGQGMGCGMGGHSHDIASSHDEDVASHAKHPVETAVTHEHAAPASAPPRRHGGCC